MNKPQVVSQEDFVENIRNGAYKEACLLELLDNGVFVRARVENRDIYTILTNIEHYDAIQLNIDHNHALQLNMEK